MINNINDYSHISTASTNQVFTGACTLVAVVVNTTSTGQVTVIDSISSNTSPIVAVLKSSIVEGVYEYNITLATGLRVQSTGTSDITVVYRVH